MFVAAGFGDVEALVAGFLGEVDAGGGEGADVFGRFEFVGILFLAGAGEEEDELAEVDEDAGHGLLFEVVAEAAEALGVFGGEGVDELLAELGGVAGRFAVDREDLAEFEEGFGAAVHGGEGVEGDDLAGDGGGGFGGGFGREAEVEAAFAGLVWGGGGVFGPGFGTEVGGGAAAEAAGVSADAGEEAGEGGIGRSLRRGGGGEHPNGGSDEAEEKPGDAGSGRQG